MLEQLLYSPNLSLSDFGLYTMLKKFLSGNCCVSDEELMTAVEKNFAVLPE